MFDNYYFGIVLSFAVFELAKKITERIKNDILRAIFNPLLISIVSIVLILTVSGIEYSDYNKGGSLISFFIGPATVALVVSLYDNLDILKKNFIPIILGIVIFYAYNSYFIQIIKVRFHNASNTSS